MLQWTRETTFDPKLILRQMTIPTQAVQPPEEMSVLTMLSIQKY